MAVSHRAGTYAQFDPAKLRPTEIAIVQSGDPNTSDGKSMYICISAGSVKRVATQDEMGTYDQSAQTAAANAEQAKMDTVALKVQVDEALTTVQTAVQTVNDLKADVTTIKEGVESDVSNSQAAATAAAEALSSVQAKAAEIEDILVHNSHKIEVGGAVTDANGSIYIYLSEDFKEALENESIYRIFLQEEGEGKVYVSEKTDTFFVVSGTEELAFSWMVII